MHAFLFAILLALGGPAANKTETKEQQFPEHNIAVTIPDGWAEFTDSVKNQNPGLLVAFGNSSRTKLIMIIRDDEHKPAKIDAQFEREYERGVEKGGGGKRKWGRFVQIAGLPGYERLGQANVSGRDTSILSQSVIAGGKPYVLSGMVVEGGDASEDSEIRTSLASFRFLTPPVADPPKGFLQEIVEQENAKRAKGFGTGMTNFQLVLGAIFLISLAIWRIPWKGKRQSGHRSSGNVPAYAPTPPPLQRPIPGSAPRAPTPAPKIVPRGGVKPRQQPPTPPPSAPPPLPPG